MKLARAEFDMASAVVKDANPLEVRRQLEGLQAEAARGLQSANK